MRKWVIVMVMCWLSTAIQADLLENVISVVSPVLNIASELNTIPSKDAQKVKSQIYQVKRFSDQSVKDNIFDYIPNETKQQLQSLNYISRELEQIIGQDYMGKLDGWLDKQVWLNTSIKDFDFRTKEQKKFEESISEIQDDITNDVTKNTAIIALLAGESIKNQSEINSHLEYLAETTKKEQEKKVKELEAEINQSKSIQSYVKSIKGPENEKDTTNHPITIEIDNYLTKYSNQYKIVQNSVLVYILFGCFVIALIWYYIKSNVIDTTVSFPFVPLIVHFFVAAFFIKNIDVIFNTIITVVNDIALKINSSSTLLLFDGIYIEKEDGFGIKTNLNNLIINISQYLFYISRIVLINLQEFLLCIIYIISPYICALSILPIFSARLIGSLFVNFIQISSWSFFRAILLLLFNSFAQEVASSASSSHVTDTFQYLLFAVLAVVVATFIPKISATFIGGGDFSAISAITTGLLGGALFKKLGAAAASKSLDFIGGAAMGGIKKGGSFIGSQVSKGSANLFQSGNKVNMMFANSAFKHKKIKSISSIR